MDTKLAIKASGRKRKWSNQAERAKASQNAERDLHHRFSSLGLSFPVKIEKVEHCLATEETIVTHHVSVSEWVRVLLQMCPEALLGQTQNPSAQLEAWWRLYEQHHPQHEVFVNHAGGLGRVIPLLLYGDEGRGPKRGNFLIWSCETPFGIYPYRSEACDCTSCLSVLPESVVTRLSDDVAARVPDELLQQARKQSTNYKEDSFATRHLLFGIPHWLYKTADARPVIGTHLAMLAANLCRLFQEGVLAGGERYYVALVASKGDLKHHMECGFLNRSYHTLSKKTAADKMMCSLCHAGDRAYPYESCSHMPDWRNTMYQSRPWDLARLPPLVTVPYDAQRPEKLFALDLFHLFKVGLGRHVAGAGITVLAKLGLWDFPGQSKGLEQRLSRAHSNFKLWASAERVAPGLRSFQPCFFMIKSKASSPWCNCKGSDTMHLCKWLRFLTRLQLGQSTPFTAAHRELLSMLKHAVESGLEIFRIVHHHGLWLERNVPNTFTQGSCCS